MEPNSLVHSDALKLLERVRDECATLLYFDPPAGTSKKDNLNDLRKLYLHASCHAKRVLKDDGVLAWHVLPERVSDVRSCLDRVFGSQYFATEIILTRRRIANTLSPTTNHTSLIVYSKTNKFQYIAPTRPINAKQYSRSDEKGPYKLADLFVALDRPTHQFSWHQISPHDGRSWRYDSSTLDSLYNEGCICISGKNLPCHKVYLSDSVSEEFGSVWDDIYLPPAERIKDYREGQQSLALLTRIISMFTKIGDIIIDPFCGSGTFILAANQLGRRWIGADSSTIVHSLALSRLQEDSGIKIRIVSDNELQSIPIKSGLTDLIRALPKPVESQHADVHELIVSHESKTLEFKQTLSVDIRTKKKDKIIETSSLKTIAGFLNSDGGTLLVGVTDDNKPVGVMDEINVFHKGSEDKFLLHFKSLVKEYIGEEFYPLIDYHLVSVDANPILRVDCKESNRPCFIGDDFYVRTNPATDKIAGPTLLKYISTRFPNNLA